MSALFYMRIDLHLNSLKSVFLQIYNKYYYNNCSNNYFYYLLTKTYVL